MLTARGPRGHIKQLSSKAYWSSFDNTPELVVLFLPSDPVLDAAARADPDLIEYAFGLNVVPATRNADDPAAHGRAVVADRRDGQDAASIHRLGVELHQRIDSVAPTSTVSGCLYDGPSRSYNSAVRGDRRGSRSPPANSRASKRSVTWQNPPPRQGVDSVPRSAVRARETGDDTTCVP